MPSQNEQIDGIDGTAKEDEENGAEEVRGNKGQKETTAKETMAKDAGEKWGIQKMTDELTKSPLAANGSFGFILMLIERLLAMQFECPCKGAERNALSASFFFVVPAVLAFLLMLAMKVRVCRCDDPASVFLNALKSVVPSIIWLVLLFLDGRYYACAKTDWEGRFVELAGASPQKWCEPFANATCIYRRNRPGTRQQCMLKSQRFVVESQWCGIALLVVIGLALLEYIIGMHYRKHYREEYGPLKPLETGVRWCWTKTTNVRATNPDKDPKTQGSGGLGVAGAVTTKLENNTLDTVEQVTETEAPQAETPAKKTEKSEETDAALKGGQSAGSGTKAGDKPGGLLCGCLGSRPSEKQSCIPMVPKVASI